MNILKNNIKCYLKIISKKFNIDMDLLLKEFDIKLFTFDIKCKPKQYTIYMDRHYNKYLLIDNKTSILIK